jgi:hypothetical protein
VFVRPPQYCSSDSWFGDAPASAATFGFAFRGARIVSAVLTALVQAHGLGSSGVKENLLLGGCSAGGRGVLTNLDYFAEAAPPNVEVKGLLDAAGWVNVQPTIPDMLTLQQMTQQIYGFATPHVPIACAAANPGSEWLCLWPSVRLPYIATPYFLNAAQFDAFQIMYDSNNLDSTYCCETPPEQAWVEQFQTSTLSLLAAIPASNGIYSSTCLVHCLSSNADWYAFTTDGVSLAQSVGAWYFQNTPTRQVSSCTGWDCTLACSGGPWMPTNTRCPTTTNQCANDYMTPAAASGPPPLPPGMSAAEAGGIAWAKAQDAAKAAAAKQAGAAAWAAAQAAPPNPYAPVANPVPMVQAQAAGNVAWAEAQAAAKAAAAKTAGNAAWSVAEHQQAEHTQNSDWDATSVNVAPSSQAGVVSAREGVLDDGQAAALAALAQQGQQAPQQAQGGGGGSWQPSASETQMWAQEASQQGQQQAPQQGQQQAPQQAQQGQWQPSASEVQTWAQELSQQGQQGQQQQPQQQQQQQQHNRRLLH